MTLASAMPSNPHFNDPSATVVYLFETHADSVPYDLPKNLNAFSLRESSLVDSSSQPVSHLGIFDFQAGNRPVNFFDTLVDAIEAMRKLHPDQVFVLFLMSPSIIQLLQRNTSRSMARLMTLAKSEPMKNMIFKADGYRLLPITP